MSNGRIDALIAQIAREHDGVFTRANASAQGFTEKQILHRVKEGLWKQLLPGVFCNVATPDSADAMRRAALLWAGDEAVLSHRSAAVLWRLDDVEEEKPELTVPAKRHPRSDLVVVHRGTLTVHDIVRRNGLRYTSAARTVIDLAADLDDEALEVAFESARRERLLTVKSVRSSLDPIAGRGRAGATRLRSLLDLLDGDAAAESKLEVMVARRLRETDLPKPVRQHWVRIFGRRYRLDFAWPELRIALECDSRRHHSFQRDRTRWRRLGASGWYVMPVTWRDVTRNWDDVVAELSSAIAA